MLKRTRIGIHCFLIFIFIAPLTAFAQHKWKGTIAKEGDVTVIKNPKKPLYRTPILELKEDLSIGGAGAQREYAMGDLRDVVVDEAGTIYVLDWQNNRIQVFDQAGTFVRTIGRKGQGPGELEIPMTMSFVQKSGELALQQASGRISFFKTDGTFVRNIVFKGFSSIRGLCDSTGQIYLTEIRPDDNGMHYVYKKLAADGTVMATLVETPHKSVKKLNPFRPLPWFQIDRNDNFVYGYPETYEIQIFGTNSKLARRIVRDYDPVAVTASERAEQEKINEGKPEPLRGFLEFSKNHAAYRWFFLSDLDHIFVATFEQMPDGKIIHDIFDSQGRFIGRIPLNRMGAGIFKGKFYAREQDKEGYPVLKRYAVTWLVK